MHLIERIFLLGYLMIVALFFVCGIGLIVLAGIETWQALNPFHPAPAQDRFDVLLECIGLLTIAVASLELGQTVLEEEIQRSANISAPTRVRRFLSRFLIVVVVALSVEALIGVFKFVNGSPQYLPHAASVGLAAAAILATWGVFIRMNTEAEKLEPEAMREVKAEDDKIDGDVQGDPSTKYAPVHSEELPEGHKHEPDPQDSSRDRDDGPADEHKK
ncbi:hypothetical protein [Telluria beijingensis]|uniref:hypothetical protein n=1 Tax=Telluria beijingensis TaxID=3068633 RepID=UPI00279577D1|nr:hypothetical protein [Massilia sp. REN29]